MFRVPITGAIFSASGCTSSAGQRTTSATSGAAWRHRHGTPSQQRRGDHEQVGRAVADVLEIEPLGLTRFGRRRFNVLGAWNAVTRRFISVTNTTVVNTDTMVELLHRIAAENLVGPITVVLDNARYQRNEVVQALAAELSITLLFLPSYSPNLNRIERLWGFAKRQSVYGKYHADFASFRAAIEATLAGIPTTHSDRLKSLMTLQFQTFEDVSLLAG